jgi:hypothetical protein
LIKVFYWKALHLLSATIEAGRAFSVFDAKRLQRKAFTPVEALFIRSTLV